MTIAIYRSPGSTVVTHLHQPLWPSRHVEAPKCSLAKLNEEHTALLSTPLRDAGGRLNKSVLMLSSHELCPRSNNYRAACSALSPTAPSASHPKLERGSDEWRAFVVRTAECFDEGRAQGGFLKTYKPISVSHVEDITSRREALRERMRASRSTGSGTGGSRL